MPWNRAIFVAMAADSMGSRRSRVFSGRLCTQEPLRVVRGLGQEGVGMGQWGRSGSRGQGPEGRHWEGAGEGGASYWDVLLQPALWKDSVELGPQGPLRKDGEHHTFKDQGVHALKEDGQRGAGVARPAAGQSAESLRPAPSTAKLQPITGRFQPLSLGPRWGSATCQAPWAALAPASPAGWPRTAAAAPPAAPRRRWAGGPAASSGRASC